MYKKLITNVLTVAITYGISYGLARITNASVYPMYFVVEIIVLVLCIMLYYSSFAARLSWVRDKKYTFGYTVVYSLITSIAGTYIIAKIFNIDFWVMYVICSFASALKVDTDRF